MPGTATLKEGMLDCQLMDAESPSYAIVRQHYLFAGLEQQDFDALAANGRVAIVMDGDRFLGLFDVVKPNELKIVWHGGDAKLVREELCGSIRARQAVPSSPLPHRPSNR